MTYPTSSANPTELAQFSADGLTVGATVQAAAATLRAAADELAATGESIAGLATFVDDLEDLALDWAHLDEFAGDVAAGFLAYLTANGLAGRSDQVVTVADGALAAHTEVGFADRDEAIRHAEEVAGQLKDLLGADDVSAADIGTVIASAAQGMHDPAFAVTFSELLGVEGYVDVVGMIREANHRDRGSGGIDDAIASVAVLGTILTTALTRADTTGSTDRDQDRPEGGRSPTDDQVLDQSFVADLVGDYDPGNIHDGYAHTDLSVLVSLTDPPTDIAVAIANSRMSATLHAATLADFGDTVDLAWGPERSGIITNYAEMLGRNPDASAEWLDTDPPGSGGSNLDLVLRQDGDQYIDDGRALARIVENGVTHTDFNLRRDIMREAIEIVGAEGDLLRNSYLPVALAKGAAADMALIDQQINVGWVDQHLNGPPPESAVHTHEFFREIMHDASAAGRVYGALETYSLEALMNAPEAGADRTPGDGIDDRTDRLRRLGAVQGVITTAEGNAYQDAAEEHLEAQGARASAVNFLVGVVPYANGGLDALATVNDAADVASVSLGAVVTPSDFSSFSDAELVEVNRVNGITLDNIVLLALASDPEQIPNVPVSEMTGQQKQAFLEWALTHYDSAGHDALTAGVDRADRAFRAG